MFGWGVVTISEGNLNVIAYQGNMKNQVLLLHLVVVNGIVKEYAVIYCDGTLVLVLNQLRVSILMAIIGEFVVPNNQLQWVTNNCIRI